MREYLKKVCSWLDFPAEAADEMCIAWDRIAENKDVFSVWNKWIKAYDQDINMDYNTALKENREASGKVCVHEYTSDLLYFLCLTKHLRELYAERNLPEQILHDSCKDLLWKLRECRKVYGIWGSFVAFWFPGFFNLTRFALGRLQFELVDFPKNYEQNGRRKPETMDKAINIHIPSAGKLTKENTKASLLQAKDFFAEAFTGEEVAFFCESWLLYKPHREFLLPDSGVVGFMDWFDIYNIEEEGDSMWRIFDRMDAKENAADLPADTALRRGYRQRLLAGLPTGYGEGIFYYNKKSECFHK